METVSTLPSCWMMQNSGTLQLTTAFIRHLEVFELRRQRKTNLNMSDNKLNAYWKENLRYLFILLVIWFIVSYGFGILLVDQLNTMKMGGAKLGFWFAQQGSIYVFVVLIFVYVYLMNKLDKKYGLDE